MSPRAFLAALGGLDFAHTFHPYRDRCPTHDRADAPRRRARMLRQLLERAAAAEIDSLWLGRDPGHRGARRTGLALTDDLALPAHMARWGLPALRPTRGEPAREATAAAVWGELERVDAAVFLWNVFPLHPHEPGRPLSNRPHNARERRAGEALLAELIDLLRPRRLIALGADAARAAARLSGGREVIRMRHPARGGQRVFRAQMRALYGS